MREKVSRMVKDVPLPKMFKVRQVFSRPKVEEDDIPKVVQQQLGQDDLMAAIRPGMRIAITVGSRGIANIALITKSIVEFVQSRGAEPFVVPAMGSHGGAVAEGQTELLAGFGVTEKYLGCPILSSMEVTEIGKDAEGRSVRIDAHAAKADGIIVCNRVKPHTSFRGKVESGIMKMMAIGLAKQAGAEQCHEDGFGRMEKNILLYGRAILEHAPILFGVALLENAFDETCKIVAMAADKVEEVEPVLLKEAFANMPRICLDSCDVLIVDEIGKNYSGEGMDPNITGTFSVPYASGGIKSQLVTVLGLSEVSHGNGVGVGCCDVSTQEVFDKLDLEAMYINAITALAIGSVKIPIIMPSHKECIQLCIKLCVEFDRARPRVVRIPNSLQLEYIMLSEAYYAEAKDNDQFVVESEPEYLDFDEAGNLK